MASATKAAPNTLLDFQRQFSQRMRNPTQTLSMDIPERPLEIYQQLLFNNVCGFIDKCFPVARSITNDDDWLGYEQAFYADWRCESPLFHTIPLAFCDFIRHEQTDLGAPLYLADLLHYEWLELAADLSGGSVTEPKVSFDQSAQIQVNPSLTVANYLWPVHKICQEFIPTEPEPSILLVYRDCHHQARFIEINELTAELIDCIKHQNHPTIENALTTLAEKQPDLDKQVIVHFGQQLIVELIQQNALLVSG